MNRMKQFKQMFLAMLKMTLREKQAWFWGIFFPVILMVIFMIIFGGNGDDDEFTAKVAIVHENPTEASNMIFNQLKEITILEFYNEETIDEKEAEQLVKEKEVDGAIILPKTEEDPSINLIINKENEQSTSTQMILGVLNSFVMQANLAVANAPSVFQLEYESVTSSEHDLNYKDFLLTGMIALSIAQGGLFGMVDLVEMRRKGIIKRLRMTPANMGLFGLSDMIMRLLFSVIQIILLTLIGVLLFGANVYINFLTLVVVFIIGVLSFNALGYFISSFSKTTEAYMGVANLFSFFMMFLSGVFLPIEMIPSWLHPISNILPLTYFAEGLRDSMVYATGVINRDLWIGIGIIVLWGLVSYILGMFLYRRKSIVSQR